MSSASDKLPTTHDRKSRFYILVSLSCIAWMNNCFWREYLQKVEFRKYILDVRSELLVNLHTHCIMLTQLEFFELNLMYALFLFARIHSKANTAINNKYKLSNKCTLFMWRIHADQTNKTSSVYCYCYVFLWSFLWKVDVFTILPTIKTKLKKFLRQLFC